MSLYLCVFHDDKEIGAVDAGAYSDFGDFRNAVHAIEGGPWGHRFPILMNQPDADGRWEVQHLDALGAELTTLASETSLNRFIDSEGRSLSAALLALCNGALAIGRPIIFQ